MKLRRFSFFSPFFKEEESGANSDGDLLSLTGEDRTNDCDNLHGSSWSLNSISVDFDSGVGLNQEFSKSIQESEMQMR